MANLSTRQLSYIRALCFHGTRKLAAAALNVDYNGYLVELGKAQKALGVYGDIPLFKWYVENGKGEEDETIN
jgi:hypothetical protein